MKVKDILDYAAKRAGITQEEIAKYGNHSTRCICDGCAKYEVYSHIKEVIGAWESYRISKGE